MIRGLHDIKTHSTLARQGRLVSVARDWHRRRETSSEEKSWDGSVNRMVFKRPPLIRRPQRDLFWDIALKKKILEQQVINLRDLIAEMEEFVVEGVNGASTELQRLKIRLVRLQNT